MEKIRLLVIDDNVQLTSAIKEYFKNNKDIEVTKTAENGSEGMDIIINQPEEFDLIILDLIMNKN